MADMVMTLADIESRLEQLERRVLLRALRPGLDAERVRSLLLGAGLRSATEVESLYSWRDGTETASVSELGDIWFFPGFFFLSLEDAIANYRSFLPDRRWMPGWLPIFANGGGDFYLTDLGEMGVVRHFRLEETEHPIEFLTINDMLITIAAGFDRALFFVDRDGINRRRRLECTA
jgi:hypothetical protein